MSHRLIAIGDIHGCHRALTTLIDAIAPTAEDVIVTLGDYVDRGPDSKAVIDELIELKKKTRMVSLLGNHEEMMLDVVRGGKPHHGWLKYGGVDTLESYGFDGGLDFLSPEQNEFFDSLSDYFVYEDYFFTHAAYRPSVSFEEQDTEVLRWHSLEDGIPGPHMSGKTAIVGHTANRHGELMDVGHLLCIDTYCYGGGWLTAIELHSRTLWQANQDGQLRTSG